MAFLIVADVHYPKPVIAGLKSPFGVVVVMAAVLYLFTKSTVLGVLGVVAGFTMVQRAGAFNTKYTAANNLVNLDYNNDPSVSTSVTLEETIIGNMLTVNNLPGKSSYQNSFSSVGNASACV
jgi:hypothetical protein